MAKPIHDEVNLCATRNSSKRTNSKQSLHELPTMSALWVNYKMKENLLIELSKNFAVEVVNLCRIIKEQRRENVLVNQLLRSGTSIGANIHEGNYASSRLDFINKFQIALKECYETEYWLDIFLQTEYITESEHKTLQEHCNKIRKILTTSIATAKQNCI